MASLVEDVTDIFTQTPEKCDCRRNRHFRITWLNEVYHGSESTSNLVLKISEIVPFKINEFHSLNGVKKNKKLGTTKFLLHALQAIYKWEFAKSRTMRVMRATVVYVLIS